MGLILETWRYFCRKIYMLAPYDKLYSGHMSTCKMQILNMQETSHGQNYIICIGRKKIGDINREVRFQPDFIFLPEIRQKPDKILCWPNLCCITHVNMYIYTDPCMCTPFHSRCALHAHMSINQMYQHQIFSVILFLINLCPCTFSAMMK